MNPVTDDIEEVVRDLYNSNVVVGTWHKIAWLIIKMMSQKMHSSVVQNSRIHNQMMSMINKLIYSLTKSNLQVSLLTKALQTCAKELSWYSDTVRIMHKQLERKGYRDRRDRAARVIQRLYRKYKTRKEEKKHLMEAQKLVNQHKAQREQIQSLTRSKENFKQAYEQMNAETGVMLIRQSYTELESLFKLLTVHFLHDASNNKNKYTRPDEERSSNSQPTFGEQRSRFYNEGVVQLGEFSTLSPTSPVHKRTRNPFNTPPLIRSQSNKVLSPTTTTTTDKSEDARRLNVRREKSIANLDLLKKK
jgi:hypothetical protein